MTSNADMLRAYLLYHVEWICLSIFLLIILGTAITGVIIGKNLHIRELEGIVNKKGVACKALLDDPVVQRIMSAR